MSESGKNPHEGPNGTTTSNDESQLPRPRWMADSQYFKSWRLINHPRMWSKSGINEDLLKNNPRLKRIRLLQSRNQIIGLPFAANVVRQFYCPHCSKIPFPWAPEYTESDLDSDDDSEDEDDDEPCENEEKFEPVPPSESVYLCENGHAICRSCYLFFDNCTFGVEDYYYMFRNAKFTGFSASVFRHLMEEQPESFGLWGQNFACMTENTIFKCVFLEDMIRAAEFACKYYYNWCSFRGNDEQLRLHEAECIHGIVDTDSENEELELEAVELKKSGPSSSGSKDHCSINQLHAQDEFDDDKNIVQVEVEDMCREIREKVNEMLLDCRLQL